MASRENLNAPVEYAGMLFPRAMPPIEREIEFIRRGGQFKKRSGALAGLGLYTHYERLIALLFPDMLLHRWFKLMLKEYLENIITVVMGPKDSSKSQSMAMIALADYYCFPYETLGLVSSTDVRGLEMRVYGAIKSLHTAAKARHPKLPGKLIDSKHALCTHDLEFDDARDMRVGLVCIPCVGSQGRWQGGLEKFVGIKQKRRRIYGDEVQFMRASYMDAFSNLNAGDFKAMLCGNPIGDGDPLDKFAEPKGGWNTMPEPQKTTVWPTRDLGGKCVNLVGTDSPNFDFPQDEPPKFNFLINRPSMDRVAARWGENSFQFYSQCKGVRMNGMDAMRVITRDLCLQYHAMEQVFWMNETRSKALGLDVAYGGIGGDRTIAIEVEWGRDVNGKTVMRVEQPVTIPVKPAAMAGRIPEEQIADAVKQLCVSRNIPPGHVFYDATGRGSLGISFARIWSDEVNPIEFGGSPSERPVTSEQMIKDHKTGNMRLMLANERFSKFVTELWWSVRYIIESGQMRELPEEAMQEGCRRMWRMVRGDKIEVETKAEMKERTSESPDIFDSLCTACEGARRLGFQIAKIDVAVKPVRNKMMDELRLKSEERARSYTLNYK